MTASPTAPEPSEELRLDRLFNKTMNAKQIAVETVQQSNDWLENSEVADQANVLLDRYRAEFKAEIRNMLAAALAKQDTQSRLNWLDEQISHLLFEVYAEDVFTKPTDEDYKRINDFDANLHTRLHCDGIRHGLQVLRREVRGLSARDDLAELRQQQPAELEAEREDV